MLVRRAEYPTTEGQFRVSFWSQRGTAIAVLQFVLQGSFAARIDCRCGK
jgi:hypothetical protein